MTANAPGAGAEPVPDYLTRYRKPSDQMKWLGAEAGVPPQMVAQTFEVVVSNNWRSMASILGPELYEECLAARTARLAAKAARGGGPQQE